MKKVLGFVNSAVLRMGVLWKGNNALWKKNDGFGLNELLGTAAALILAAFVIIPGLTDFAKSVMESLGDWWDDTIAEVIFPDH